VLNEFRLGMMRPGLVVVPPKVWHGVQNLADEPSSLVNLVDQAYRYENPDHWRVPPDSPHVPYRFRKLVLE
jgi:dTDP-4-dehydrorhamnose 3,5-epimerase